MLLMLMVNFNPWRLQLIAVCVCVYCVSIDVRRKERREKELNKNLYTAKRNKGERERDGFVLHMQAHE